MREAPGGNATTIAFSPVAPHSTGADESPGKDHTLSADQVDIVPALACFTKGNLGPGEGGSDCGQGAHPATRDWAGKSDANYDDNVVI